MTGRGVGTDRFAFLIGNCWVILLVFDYFFSLIYIILLIPKFQKFLSKSVKMYQECKNKQTEHHTNLAFSFLCEQKLII